MLLVLLFKVNWQLVTCCFVECCELCWLVHKVHCMKIIVLKVNCFKFKVHCVKCLCWKCMTTICQLAIGKRHVCIIYKTYEQKINGSTSFAIDNMYHVSFRIQKQESIPWCVEIQNQRSEVLENTFNLHSNSICAQEVWFLTQFICVCSKEN